MTKKIIAALTVICILTFTSVLSKAYIPAGTDKPNKPEVQEVPVDKGVGPFKDVKLSPVDQMKARKGLGVFMDKCFLCHELDNKKLGPPLRNITKQETPEFILNMIVNPTEMQKQNDRIKEQMKKYNNLPMLDQQISQQDALNILEYLRSTEK
jgi:mono/diheme cytochrome c family protein